MAKRRKFYIYQRQKKHGRYFYVCYIDPETGKQGNAKSIDVLKEKLGKGDNEATINRDDAVIIANKALEAGLIFNTGSEVTFSSYCLSFWDFDNSSYIKLRNLVSPNSIGKEYAMNMLCNLKKHVLPFIPSSLKLSCVTTRHLDKVISEAFSLGLANGTIQMIILSFSVPFKEAMRLRYITSNPCDGLMKIPRRENTRGVFSDDEVKKILNSLDCVDVPIRNAIKLAISTGMRSGEIRALKTSDIIREYHKGENNKLYDKIIISHSLAPYSGIKATKGKYERSVLIPSELGKELIAASKDGIIISFNGSYVSSLTLRLAFYELLNSIGITEDIRKERRLTFHSLRHYFSTYTCQENISQEDRMLVLGHRSEKVNSRYTHISDLRLERVAGAVERLIINE